jgi:uncharacterized protein (DUF885 family)
MLRQPVREHTETGLQQVLGSLEIFSILIPDSVNASNLTPAEKDTLLARCKKASEATNHFATYLKSLLNDENFVFRDYRIGEKLFEQKFRYSITADYTAEEIYKKAQQVRFRYYSEMFRLSRQLWPTYFPNSVMPTDSMETIRSIIAAISLQHVMPEALFTTVNQQITDLKKFIIEKELFRFDADEEVRLRIMPAFAMGVTIASANFPPVFAEEGVAYYNISDLTGLPAEEAESILREYNHYSLQLLSIHEGIPGHCLQGIYNRKNNANKISGLFASTAMVEGWANYCHRMMLENGWGNSSPEIWLMFYKSALKECFNVIIDYGIHCLNFSEQEVRHMLINEAFQEEAQFVEKYKRAKLTQVQLSSYFTGVQEIESLLESFKKQKGRNFSLVQFHEEFLSYGSAPVKYIREMMLEE